MERIESGHERKDVGRVSWGASDLSKLVAKMADEAELWAEWQRDELEPHILRARQIIIQLFPTWLAEQAPANDAPGTVGDWKHWMLRLIGANLKSLSLNDEYAALEERALSVARNAEAVAEARQLLRDVENWITQHGDACRIVRVTELRGLIEIGKGFSSKLQGLVRRVDLPDINEMRTRLSEFMSQMKLTEKAAVDRAMRLWDSKPRSADDLEALCEECKNLLRVFEGCEIDLKDLRILARCAEVLQRSCVRLSDENITWGEFETLSATLEGEMNEQFEEGDLPWSPVEVLGALAKTATRTRKDRGEAWLMALQSEAEAVDGLSALDANRLLVRATSTPAYLTEAQVKRSKQVVRKVERHLSALAVEWLLEKFKELPSSAKTAFLKAASKLVGRE